MNKFLPITIICLIFIAALTYKYNLFDVAVKVSDINNLLSSERVSEELNVVDENLRTTSTSTTKKEEDSSKTKISAETNKVTETSKGVKEKVTASGITKDILNETNKARTSPKTYLSSTIQPWHDSIKTSSSGDYVLIGTNTRLLLREGKTATNELINYLKSVSPKQALRYDSDLEKAARDHALDVGKNGSLGHTGSDGSNVGVRAKRYTTWRTVGENISYGSKTGVDVIRSLMIDDGVANRGHRVNIMNPSFTRMGAYCGNHNSQYGYVCVIVYAG